MLQLFIPFAGLYNKSELYNTNLRKGKIPAKNKMNLFLQVLKFNL